MEEFKVKDWYNRIIKNGITHYVDETDNTPKLILTRIEYLYPNINHVTAHSTFRLKGLSPTLKSVLFQLKNDLYPSQERLFRCHKAENSNCLHCPDSDTHGHFLICPASVHVFRALYTAIETFAPSLPLERIVSGDIVIDDDKAFTIVWLLATSTEYYWDCRRTNNITNNEALHGIIKAKLKILSHISALESYYLSINRIVNTAVNSN